MFSIDSVSIENFGSFVGKHRWKLPAEPGLYSITGQNLIEPSLTTNNCGKTTLLEAIIWCLYGRTSRGLRAGDIVSWGEKSCSVAVGLTIGEGSPCFTRHFIIRSQNPNSLMIAKDDGELIVAQDELDKVLRLGADQFCYSVMFPQFGDAFFDLGATAKLDLFTQIMGLDFWLDKAKLAADTAKELLGQQQGLERQLARTKGQRDVTQQDLINLQERFDNFEADQRVKKKELKRRLKDARDTIVRLISEIDRGKATIRVVTRKIEEGAARACVTCGQQIPSPDFETLQRNRRDHESEVVKYERQKAQAESEVKRLTEESNQTKENPYGEMLRDRCAALTDLSKSMELLRRDIAQISEDHSAAEYWGTGFKRIRLSIVESALVALEVEVNNNLASLGLPDWQVKFDIERETKAGGVSKGFTVTVHAPNRVEPVRWEAFSGGATQRLRLAGNLGLANLIMERAGLNNTIEFYDEFSAHLSAAGVNDVLETLSERALSLGRRIFVIDHHSLDFGDFAGIIRVVKTEKGSEIKC